jgi:hypothetical protein
MRLRSSLALAESCLRSLSQIFVVDAGDPLKMDLPPLIGNGGAALTPQTLRVFGAMYLQAELEQTGVILVAESLAEARFSLPIRSQDAVRKLEAFAQLNRRWFKREQRDLVFARVFGIGRAATSERGADVNHDFQQGFATFCAALDRFAAERASAFRPIAGSDAMIRRAAADLLMNLSNRQHGNTLLAARRIQEQLQASIQVLSHQGIAEYFAVRGMWAVVRAALTDQAPDLGRIITRGQSGLQLLNWLASVSSKLAQGTSLDSELGPSSSVFLWASQWLSATGLPSGQQQRSVA